MLETTLVEDGIDARLGEFRVRRSEMKGADRYFYLQPTVGPVNHRVHDGRRSRDGHARLLQLPRPHRSSAHRRAAAERAVDAVRHRRGRRAAAHGHERPARALESRIAEFAQRDDACVYSSGYVTNIAIITGLTGPGDLILMDKLDHASIVDGALLSGAKWRTYRHNDMDHLEKLLASAQGEYNTVLVVADSVFSMDGDIMDLPTTKALCERYGARLMVDEAHSIGSLGATGHGIEEHFDMVGLNRPEDGDALEVDPEHRRLSGGRRGRRRLPAALLAAVHLLGRAAAGVDGRRARGVRRDRGRAMACR